MQLIAPDVLAEGVGLSPLLCGLGLGLGLMLWLFGWRGHRFWIVLLGTVMAGIYGMARAPDYGSQPLLSGILLAIAIGMLALALVRVIAFVAGGVTATLLINAFAHSWQEPMVCFLVGGLLGLLMFRTWTMLLTSLAGAVLMGYSGLCLADRLGKLSAVAWSEKQALLLNWACGLLTLVGFTFQVISERRRAKQQGEGGGQAAPKKEGGPPPAPAIKNRILGWIAKIQRKAG
jgi:hypothetical protein